MPFTAKPTNGTNNGGKQDFQNTSSDYSAKYLTIIFPILAILIVLGMVAAIFYRRRCVYMILILILKQKSRFIGTNLLLVLRLVRSKVKKDK